MPAVVPIDGISIGHFSDYENLTGCTVVLAPKGAVASVDVRGGAPGTMETALLSPLAAVGELHAVLLTGGSALGLGAAAGVSQFLRERGFGYQTPFGRVPLVSSAVIYDLNLGSSEVFPRPADAYSAAATADTSVEEGSVGVGTGATVGKILGFQNATKGGVGLATVVLGSGVTVCALSVVNALGDVLDENGSILAGARGERGFVGGAAILRSMESEPSFAGVESTTLSVVITDAALNKTECKMIARMSHDGMARAIDPVHTPLDGDCIFVLSTGARAGSVLQIGAAAAEAVAMSIRRAVREARGLGGIPGIGELCS